ncbi:glutathione S-transferase T3 isoform X3 [Brachypodium distachyon]|uniref:glutathione S-transferase T3 isoform X3 n=1 Tax=Brachypodium distachyon TaxID=15368 RepID=UPI00052FE258|nr:glutathione S-transferase T3 isoform X3 [Brachypodium distachyon]|eukprot:XP_024311267.1 glutathione S-transferase T3 isoform X3 [Brachypodium distachyon]
MVPPTRGAEPQPQEPRSESFLNMIDEGIDIDAFLLLKEVEEVPPPKTQKRSSNYTHDEDIQLCKSWINISTDAIVGNEQPGKSYWARIAEHYHENRTFESDRNANSLEHRWNVLQKECMKWQANFEQVERRHESGIPYKEHMKERHALYANGEPKNKSFQYVHCWLEVRHTPKFLALDAATKRSRSTPSDEVGDGDDDSNSPTPDSARKARPVGRKKAKEMMKNAGEGGSYKEALKDLLQVREKEGKMREERWKEAEDRQEHKLSLEEHKFQWEQEQQIMFCDVNALETDVKVWVLAEVTDGRDSCS